MIKTSKIAMIGIIMANVFFIIIHSNRLLFILVPPFYPLFPRTLIQMCSCPKIFLLYNNYPLLATLTQQEKNWLFLTSIRIVHSIKHKNFYRRQRMSDLSATQCGCGCGNGFSLGNGNSCSCIWIIILLLVCGGNGGGCFSGNGCGCDNDCIWIILILLFCCGNNNGGGCGGCGCGC